MILTLIARLAFVAGLLGCSDAVSSSNHRKFAKSLDDGDGEDDARGTKKNKKSKSDDDSTIDQGSKLSQSDDETRKSCSIESGRRYRGFGNTDLVAGRVTEVPIDMDRFRLKPLSVLSADFNRIFGSVPSSLERNRTTFIHASDRWYIEPKASGVTIFSTYRIAYEGSLAFAATNPMTAAAPSEESATEVCSTFAEMAWNQAASEAQIDACRKVAVIDTATEPDVKARWAYAFAAILTATEFVAY